MTKAHIITDSGCAMSLSEAEKLGVTLLPLGVRIGDKVYQDGIDLNREELLLRMANERIRPIIVGPTVEQFREIYSQLTRRTNQIISLHSSAHLSPVHHQAQIAAREFMGRCNIAVVDSGTVSLGLSILVREAVQLTKASMPLNDILRHVRGITRRIYIVFITDTLDYIEHSRLISPTQAILGAMLGIKPFLAIEEGRIIPIEKVRSRERAIDKLAEFVNEFSDIEQLAVLQNTPYPTEETKMLQERLSLIIPGKEYPILLYGPLLASYLGPDALGLVVYERAQETMTR